MAVVIFDPAAFKLAFPEFADVPDARLELLFGMVTATILDNTGASPVIDVTQRSALLSLLVAHMLTLYGTGTPGAGGGSGGTAPVGRLASATEGTVSTSFAYMQGGSPTADWYNQTQYGAMYWVMMARFRSMRYVPAGRSGVGHSIDYLNGSRVVQRRGNNSGTPGGV